MTRPAYIVLGCIACLTIIANVLVSNGTADDSPKAANVSWEYKSLTEEQVGRYRIKKDDPTRTLEIFETGINELGEEGWEFVSVVIIKDGNGTITDGVFVKGERFLFKRQKNQ